MKNFAKQFKLIAVLLIAVVMVIGMTFAVSAEKADDGNAVDLSGITWVLKGTQRVPNRLVYTGKEYTVEPINLPEGVTLVEGSEKNCSATDAGDYNATVSVKYTVDGVEKTEKLVYKWSIAKATYNVRGVKFKDGTLVYNGEPQMLAITGNLPEGVTVSYSAENYPEGAINAGVYTVTANFGVDKNHEPIPSMSATLTIVKATYDMSGITFADGSLTYCGVDQTLAISGELPAGVKVYYDGFKTVGTHKVTASFKGDDLNYEPIPSMTATLTITPATAEDCIYLVKDSTGRVVLKVVSADGIPADKVVMTDKSYLYSDLEITKYYSVKVFANYGIGFSFKGVTQSVDEHLTVTLLIPEMIRDNENLELVHITDDGNIVKVDAKREGDSFVFETYDVTSYAIIEGYRTLDDVKEPLPWWMILLFVLDGLSIAFYIVALCLKPRDPEAEEPKAEEPKAEEPKAEKPKAEEPKAEEPKAEEPKAEEPKAEEPKAEEPAEDELEAEEESEAEDPVTESNSEVLEPSMVIDEYESLGKQVIDGQVVMVRYRSSFMSRLIQADKEIQDYYTVLKNTLLSYKGVKERISWNYESFNKGRFQCAKLNIKGRTLTLYLALDPKNYNAGKYHFTDLSDNPKFDKVPMLLKIRSDRALRYAVELIEDLMRTQGIEAGAPQNVDYHMPYETNEKLAERDLVKIILPDGVNVGENDSFVSVDVSDVIGGSAE